MIMNICGNNASMMGNTCHTFALRTLFSFDMLNDENVARTNYKVPFLGAQNRTLSPPEAPKLFHIQFVRFTPIIIVHLIGKEWSNFNRT